VSLSPRRIHLEKRVKSESPSTQLATSHRCRWWRRFDVDRTLLFWWGILVLPLPYWYLNELIGEIDVGSTSGTNYEGPAILLKPTLVRCRANVGGWSWLPISALSKWALSCRRWPTSVSNVAPTFANVRTTSPRLTFATRAKPVTKKKRSRYSNNICDSNFFPLPQHKPSRQQHHIISLLWQNNSNVSFKKKLR